MRYGLPIAVGIITFLVNSTIIGYLFQTFPWLMDATFPEGGVWWLDKGWPIKILYVGLLAPVFEEIIFRGGIFGWFKEKNRVSSGLLVSSIAFGLYHMAFGWGWPKAVDMTVVGFIFGWVYLKHGLKGATACHMANNFTSLIFIELTL